MKQIEIMAAKQTRKELQTAIGKLVERQEKLKSISYRLQEMKHPVDLKNAQDIVADSINDLEEVFKDLNGVNNWLCAFESNK